MGIFVFAVFSSMVAAGFIYEYSADYVGSKCFDEYDREQMIERFGEHSIDEADEDEDTFMVFNMEKAGPFIFMMLITYRISYPVRWFIGLFG